MRLIISFFFLCLAQAVKAVPKTWNGGAAGSWTNASNWKNNSVPPSVLQGYSEIIINPIVAGKCILNVPQTISLGAKLTVIDNKDFVVNGNLIIQ